ncbi:OmpA family protein [Fluviispira multicolorata]|uniref:OmpA family protein n=1 Tax=Fluviispira multicolorata TaxID=2654512 RepID=A0A833JD37_9BACT|nr:OmpA family protein [Fluviispira multicolorata]KAB8031061.1 OmpA family protein [Fluviispira multicolorata]
MKLKMIFKIIIKLSKLASFILLNISISYSCTAISLISYFFQTSYPIEECTPTGLATQSIKLTYSERSNIKNEFLVSWDLYSNKKIAYYQMPTVGGEVQIARCLPPGRWVFLGRGNVESINGNTVEAIIKGIDITQYPAGKYPRKFIEMGNLYWRPMAGDVVFPVEKIISRKILISPKFEIAYENIFTNLGNGNYSFDLTPEGQEYLDDKFSYFKNLNGRLEIDGFYLTSGDKEQLRLESLMRAQAVGNYLVRRFNLNPEQVVTLGYGNDWLQSGMQPVKSWPQKNLMRGVILKLLPENN